MPRVKICGITNLHDARVAVDAGADALGFILYDASPRHLSPQLVADLIRQLPPFVAKVGVFANAALYKLYLGNKAFLAWVYSDNMRNVLVYQYWVLDQELPALYTIGKLHRLMAYTGEQPFADQALVEIRQAKTPGEFNVFLADWVP